MKIFVCIKQVPDTETKVKVAADGKSLDATGVKWVMNPYDEFAVEESLKIRDQNPGSQVFVVTVGSKKRTVDALRTALAMGADEGIVVDAPENLDALATAEVLAKCIQAEGGAQLILTGKLAIDDNASAVSQMLAEYLVIAHTTVASKITWGPESITVERDVEGGAKEVVQLKLPAVVAANKGLNLPRYASLPGMHRTHWLSEEKVIAAQRLASDLRKRVLALIDLGLGYLSLDRSTPTLSPGELQRLRLASQLSSQLFGVVYVLDEPSAGLHPADGEALLAALQGLKAAGNSIFVVEHDVATMRRADWLVDVGPAAGEHGGEVLYSGPPAGLAGVERSQTRHYLFRDAAAGAAVQRTPRNAQGWLQLEGVTRNNLHGLDAAFPLACMTAVTGVSGSGKSSLVSQALLELVSTHLGRPVQADEEDAAGAMADDGEAPAGDASPLAAPVAGRIAVGSEHIRRLVQVDQKPIGRTPRSNLATYTGLFDGVRKLFAATPAARKRRYDAGRFSFNVAKGRCATCEGEGFVSVELLFMPSVYAPCPSCHGARYNAATLEIEWNGLSIAGVLGLTVDAACDAFAGEPQVLRALAVLRDIGLGYLRLGQPATELSGGEAQRIKLATELQRREQRGGTLYVLDEPTTGLHPADVDRLLTQLDGLVAAGNTVVVVEHEMRVVAACDWVIDIGPGAGEEGGRIVAQGSPGTVAGAKGSRTAPYLAQALGRV